MGLDNITFTLYDLLGYLLPGYVLVFVCSLIESTFLNGSLLSLDRVSSNLLPFTVVAYFLGHIAHGIGSMLRDWRHNWFTDRSRRLSGPVFEHVRQTAKDTFEIKLDGETKLDTFETYLLADSYVVASGSTTDRDIYMAREGFFKASMVAFGLVSLVSFGSLIMGGLKIQVQTGTFVGLHWSTTLVLAVLFICVSLLFRRGFIFYNRVKINNTLLQFLALREKDLLKEKESAH